MAKEILIDHLSCVTYCLKRNKVGKRKRREVYYGMSMGPQLPLHTDHLLGRDHLGHLDRCKHCAPSNVLSLGRGRT